MESRLIVERSEAPPIHASYHHLWRLGGTGDHGIRTCFDGRNAKSRATGICRLAKRRLRTSTEGGGLTPAREKDSGS